MSIAWRPVIEIFHANELIGFVELPHLKTEVLPRVGEFVGLDEAEICKALKLDHRMSNVPVVTSVRHDASFGETNVSVHIKMNSNRERERVDELARMNSIDWTPA